jgi:hypothetical protein
MGLDISALKLPRSARLILVRTSIHSPNRRRRLLAALTAGAPSCWCANRETSCAGPPGVAKLSRAVRRPRGRFAKLRSVGKEAPRPGGGAAQRASVVTTRARIARQGEEGDARQPELSRCWHDDAKPAQMGRRLAERKRKAARRRPLQNIKLSVRSGHHARRAILSTMERRVAKPRKTDEHHRPSRRLRHTAGLRYRWPRHVELERVRGGACGK